jgi:polysaccharide pyruvyl transferase WcaK-like protein
VKANHTDRTHRPVRIALMGPFGFGNLGDAAIQDAAIQNIRRIHSDAEIFGVSQNPADTQKRHGIPAFPLNRMPRVGAEWEEHPREDIFSSFGTWLRRTKLGRMIERAGVRLPLEFLYILRSFKNLWGFDILVVSGGGQLDDYWGGPWSHPYTLAKWGTIAKIVGARFVFLSVGAGPIDYSASKRLLRYALSRAEYRSFRDERSRRLITSIGFDRNDPVCPDLAYSLPVEEYTAGGDSKAATRIGVGPMSYFHPALWPESDNAVYEGYLRKLASFITRRINEGSQIVLFPGEIGSDRAAMDDLLTMIQNGAGTAARDQIERPDIRSVRELMTLLSRTDINIASRFHGVLLSHVAGKPVVALSYHMKIDALMEEMGHAQYCLDIKTFTSEAFEERFQALRKDLSVARECISKKMQEYRGTLDGQYRKIFS